jgi:nicotinamidase-related amidase
MPLDLHTLVSPTKTAVLTMEMQRGVIGDLATVPALAGVVEKHRTVDHVARLVAGARQAGVRVVHCTAERRADDAGSVVNCPMLAIAARDPERLLIGTASAQVVPELGPADSDLVSPRVHGMSPFAGTSLDITLRNLGVSTVVATGVSLNIGVLGMVIEAVNLGYQVVVPTDCVAGVPDDYAEAVLANSVAFLATRTTADRLLEVWAAGATG